MTPPPPEPTAAASGNAATDSFRASGKTFAGEVDNARVNKIATRAVQAINDIAREERLTYDEYNAFKAWLIKVGEDGEWPLFLDVWLEHTVEEVNTDHRQGSKGTIEGPYYVAGSPEKASPATIDMCEDEKGTPLLFQGTITSVDGTPLPDAKVELWHADEDGLYFRWEVQGASSCCAWWSRSDAGRPAFRLQFSANRPAPDPGDRRGLRPRTVPAPSPVRPEAAGPRGGGARHR
ncbi:dioxygenase [Brevibacterium litoralis]|uniref:dioxygenase n=1 Tax=Brevibacterium litoralis TaxID=3138935 RepID=UPI0032EFCA64